MLSDSGFIARYSIASVVTPNLFLVPCSVSLDGGDFVCSHSFRSLRSASTAFLSSSDNLEMMPPIACTKALRVPRRLRSSLDESQCASVAESAFAERIASLLIAPNGFLLGGPAPLLRQQPYGPRPVVLDDLAAWR